MTLPPGYVAVPEEPTERIVWAIRRKLHQLTGHFITSFECAKIYAEGLAARPPLPDNQDEDYPEPLRLRDEFLVASGLFDAFNDWLEKREAADNQEGAAVDIPACSCPYDEAPHPCQWRYNLAECLAAAQSSNQAPGHTPAGGEVFGTPTVAFQNRYQSPLYQEGGDAPSTRKSTTTGRPESTSACEPAPGHTPAGGAVCPTCGDTGETYCLGVDEDATCPTCFCPRCHGTGCLPADHEAALSRLAETDAALMDEERADFRARHDAPDRAAKQMASAPDGDEVERACAALRAAYLCSPDGTWVQGGTEKIVRMVLRAALTAKETKG